MVTTDLGACEWFVWDLRRSNLIDRGQLDQIIGEFLEKHPQAEPPTLAAYLVSKEILTQFQADRLLQGKTQGFVLGPFTLMDALGTGSMGTVYKARSKNDNDWYAVKVLPRRSMWNVRIARRKVRAFEECQHQAVVPFVDVGTAGGMHYLAWPLIAGESLDKRVERQGKLLPGLAARFIQQAAEGLAVCHKKELFHGQLKPSNLMIGPDEQVRILDLGIGSLLAETEGESLVDTMSTANSVASGLDCASPESIMDPTNLTPLGDQYSLGCCLYYALTGRYPFPDGTTAEKMMAHQFKQPTSVRELNPDVPEALLSVVERLMQKGPEARYKSIAEAAGALRPLAISSERTGVSSCPPISQRSLQSGPSRTSAPIFEEIAPRAEAGHPPARKAAEAAALSSHQAPHAAPSTAGREPSRPRDNQPNGHGMDLTSSRLETPHVTPRERPAIASDSNGQGSRHLPTAKAASERVSTPGPSRPAADDDSDSARCWEEQMGPIVVAVGALILSALAWVLTWKLF
jgi:serine/threonine-protein kinase